MTWGDRADGGEEGLLAAVVSGPHTPPILRPSEQDPDHRPAGHHAVMSREGTDRLASPPSFPTDVEHCVRPMGSGRIAPSYAIAIDEDNPARHMPVLTARRAMGPGKEKLKTRHPHIAQPEKIRHFPRALPEP